MKKKNAIHLQAVFRIRSELNTGSDSDPAFKVNTDPDPDSGFSKTKLKEELFSKNLNFIFSQKLLHRH